MTDATPAERLGALFEEVQRRALFGDGKTFADAVALRPDAEIVREHAAGRPWTAAALGRFVAERFALPAEPPPPAAPARAPLAEHIAGLWPVLMRETATVPAGGSAISLPHPFVVPGGRFRELYYWDSYFTMLGLARDGRDDLTEGMIDGFGSLIECYGHIPNGTRTYYLGRSQPPMFWLMIGLSKRRDAATLARRIGWLRHEHAFWMAGAPGAARVVRLADGALLNRYWDARDTPRDESWREDVATASAAPARPAGEVYRDLRAGAESGWDFSARWLDDPADLATIRTTAIVPVDLNALLWGMERAIAEGCRALGEAACAAAYEAAAAARGAAIIDHLWDGREGRFADHDWRRGRRTTVASAAMLYPLFTGLATMAQADAVARTAATTLLAPGGLRTTSVASGQQWDAPNGWAPLQWIAVAGLRRYGHDALADEIAARFLAMVARDYQASGRLREKYDVETGEPGGGGEYAVQDGFGWTNGVVRELLAGAGRSNHRR